MGLHRHPHLRAVGVLRHRGVRLRAGVQPSGLRRRLGGCSRCCSASSRPWRSPRWSAGSRSITAPRRSTPRSSRSLCRSCSRRSCSRAAISPARAAGCPASPRFYWSLETWFWLAGALLVVVTGAAWLFVQQRPGRVLVAIRENEARCAYLGIPVSRIKILLMVASAGMAAVAGFGYAMFTDVVAPELTGFLLGTELLIWVALGGRGTLIGPVIGAIADRSDQLLSVAAICRSSGSCSSGIAFVVVIVVLPQGLMPLLTGAWRSLMPRRRERAQAPALRVAAGAAADATRRRAAGGRGLHRNFGSLQVLKGIDFTAHARRDPEPGRAERRRQDHPDPLPRRRPRALRRHGPGLWRGPRPPTARRVHRARHRPQVPGRECLRHADGRRMSARRPRSGSSRRPAGVAPGCSRLPDAAVRIAEETGLAAALDVRSASPQPRPEAGPGAGDGAGARAERGAARRADRGADQDRAHSASARFSRPSPSASALSILLVEHDLDFVREISSRVIVLHQGRIVLDGTVEEVVESELVRTIYAGTAGVTAEAAP